MKEYKDPYLAVAAPRLQMAGKNAPRSTVFGMLGVGGGARGGVADGVKSLGGLVMNTTKVKVHDKTVSEKHAYATEHGKYGKNSTEIPGCHMGMVPYPGYYMKAVGKSL
jgi:hypothetical protein